MADNVEDYLEKGMYGAKELHPEEKKCFLGTFRERVILAMHKEDVLAGKFGTEVQHALATCPTATLLLNSQLSYEYLRPYIHIAEKYHHPFSIVTRKLDETDIFLVVTASEEVNVEAIFPSEATLSELDPSASEKSKKSFFQKIQALWKKDKKGN